MKRLFLPLWAISLSALFHVGCVSPRPTGHAPDPHANAVRYLKAGNRAYAMRNVDEAIVAYRKAAEAEQTSCIAWNNLGVALSLSGRHQEAAGAFARALDCDPGNINIALQSANALYRAGDFTNAANSYFQAHSLPSTGVELSFSYDIINRDLDPVARDEASLMLKPNYVEAWFNQGDACIKIGLHDAAVSAFREAARLKPERAESWYNLGLALDVSERIGEAVDAYAKAVEVAPDYIEAWNNLGVACGKTERLEESVAAFRRMLELGVQNPAGTWNNLCVTYLRMRDRQKAREAWLELKKLDEALAAKLKPFVGE